MSLHKAKSWFVLAAALMTAAGCQPSRPFYFFEDGDLSHYKGVATELEYPDVDSDTLSDVEQAQRPLTVANPNAREIWELKLEEAVQITLTNSKMMRTLGGQVVRPSNQLLTAPQSIQNVYNAAIVESDPRFGTEATLSQFDTQFSTSMFWERNDHPVNLSFPGFIARVFEQDLGTFRAEFGKTAATGTRFALRNNTTYEWNNNPSNLYPSAWNTNLEAEFRHPLLRASGVQFNRIAGTTGIPGIQGFNDIPGVYNGPVLARINTDIALAQFEAGVRNLVSDAEVAYWELYFAYRNLDALLVGRDSALQTWRKVYALFIHGARGGEAEKEAQAREQYFLFRGQVESAQSNVFAVENRLRFMMGIAATDGRLIRPADDPTTARVQFDWNEVSVEALARTAELRQQKWVVKQNELKLIASKNFLLPRLDAVGRYRWVGFGDDLITANRQTPTVTDPFPTAWQTLTGGDYQEWQLGLSANIPIGFRAQLAGVRNAQLQLAQSRALLQDQELEVSHLLTDAVRDLDRAYRLAETNFNRQIAAKANVDAVQAAYETDTITLDLLLDAQRRLAVAQSDYYRSVVDYNLAIRNVHLRKGSLLDYNGVYLAEGPWPGKAYFDARKRARERDAGYFLDYGFTRPSVVSRGPIPQETGNEGEIFRVEGVPTPAGQEGIPAPAPMQPQQRRGAALQPLDPYGMGPQFAPTQSSARPARDDLSYDWNASPERPAAVGARNALAPPPNAGAAPATRSNVRRVSYDLSIPAQRRPDETIAHHPTVGVDRPAANR